MQKFPIHFCLVYNKRSINFLYFNFFIITFFNLLTYLRILKNTISLLFSLIYLFTNIEKHKISKSQCAAFTDGFFNRFFKIIMSRGLVPTCLNISIFVTLTPV
jgi:hypothetical protein